MTATATLLYRPAPPAHYVARFGTSGWCEGWGWGVEDAIDDLAGVVERVVPPEVPDHALADRAALVAWLQGLIGDPQLDE